MNRRRLTDIEVRVIHQTDAAWLVESLITGREAWVPKSVADLEFDMNDPIITTGARANTLTMPEYMAEEKELI